MLTLESELERGRGGKVYKTGFDERYQYFLEFSLALAVLTNLI